MAANGEGVPGWLCTLCTYVNAFEHPTCAMCTAEQPLEPEIGIHTPDPSLVPMQSSAPLVRDFWIEETRPEVEVRRANKVQQLNEYIGSTLHKLKFEHIQMILAYTLAFDVAVAHHQPAAPPPAQPAEGSVRVYGSGALYKARLPQSAANLTALIDRRLLLATPTAGVATAVAAVAAAPAAAAPVAAAAGAGAGSGAAAAPAGSASPMTSAAPVASAVPVASASPMAMAGGTAPAAAVAKPAAAAVAAPAPAGAAGAPGAAGAAGAVGVGKPGTALVVRGPFWFDSESTTPDTQPLVPDAAKDTKTGGAGAELAVTAGKAAGGVLPLPAAPTKPPADVHGGAVVTATALLADGRVATAADCSVFVWDKTVDRVMLRLSGASGADAAAALGPGQVAAGHSAPVTCVVGLPDGRIATGSADGTVRVWVYSKGEYKSAAPLTGHNGPVTALAAFSDNRFASAGADGTVRLHDKSGRFTSAFVAHKGAVTCLTVVGDGRLLVTGGADCTVRVWERTRCVTTGVTGGFGAGGGHAARITALCALPNGQFASGAADGTVCVWSAETGKAGEKPLWTLPPPGAGAKPVTAIVAIDDF